MIKFIKRVFGKSRVEDRKPSPAPLFAAPLESDWTDENRNAWRAFILSPAGSAFLRRAYAVHYSMLHNASLDADPRNRAKVAQGFRDCLTWAVSLSSVENESRQTSIGAAGEPESDEMREYVARMSP